MKEKKNKKGTRIVTIFVPAALTVFLLYVVIVVCTFIINSASTKVANEMNTTSANIKAVSSLQSRNSKLFQTASSFVQKPILNDNSPNTAPLQEYVMEYVSTKDTFDNVYNQLKDSVDADTLALLDEAAKLSDFLVDTQLHAINVILSSDKISLAGYEWAKDIPSYELNDEDLAVPKQYRIDYAKGYMESNYNRTNGDLNSKLSDISSRIRIAGEKEQKDISFQVKMARGVLWLGLILILLANFACLFIVVFMLVVPIVKFTKRIDKNERLDDSGSLYEAKRLAAAYNQLLDRHKEFENELRVVAELDALTGLPNRYSYNSYLNNPSLDERSVCIFIFDINNLKYVNDTFGHDKGDELIKNASECIKQCFLIEEKKNCYRIGGDEFVAVLENIYEEDIEKYIAKFRVLQEVKNVSIAVGYSYARHINEIGYEKLFIDADQKMYENKNEMKKNLQEK